MSRRISVSYGDEVVTGVTTPLHEVETERKYGAGTLVGFRGATANTEAMYWMMWRSLHPTAPKDDDAAFLAWLPRIESFTVEGSDLPPPPEG